MKNDNTKEKRMQTLPLLYYINKTPFYKLFSIKNLYQIAVCVLNFRPLVISVSAATRRQVMAPRGTEIRTQNCSRRMITVLETAVLPLNYTPS